MKNFKTIGNKTMAALAFALALAACGGDSPETLLASAKDYLARNDPKTAAVQLKNALQKKPDLAEARFLLGKALLDEGNVIAAEVELRKAASLRFPSDELTPLRARAMLMLGQAKRVIEEFSQTQLRTPESQAELQTALANAYLAESKNDLAKARLDAALATVPDFGRALYTQARIRLSEQDVPGATALLDKALANDPSFHEALQLRGDILAYEGQTDSAIAFYRAALQAKPNYLPAYVSMITRLIEAGRMEEAARDFEEMRQVAPKAAQTSYVRAELMYRQKQFAEAREAIQHFLRFAPENPIGQQLAGAIEFELKSYPAAERYLQAVLTKAPRTGIARRILITSFLRSGKPDKALGALQPILGEIGDDSNLLALAGEVFMQNGNADRAGEYFARASKLDPANKSKQTAVALTHLAKGETDTAYKALEKIASTDTGIQADMALIAAQLRNRQFDLALKSIGELGKKRGKDPLVAPLVANLRGTALLGKRDAPGARAAFESAIAANPEYFPAVKNLAMLDLAEKKPENAKQRFRDMIARNPNSSLALLALADLEGRTGGKKEDVLALITQAVASNPTDIASRLALINFHIAARDPASAVAAAQNALTALPDNSAILDAQGRAQQASGNYNQAISTYVRLSELNPGTVQPYLRMADIHFANRDKNSARQALNRALAIMPESIEAQRGLLLLDLNAGRIEDAVRTARNIQKQHPENPVGYLLEGDSYSVGKEWKEAIEAYRNGIRQTGAGELAMALHNALVSRNTPGEADKFAASWLKDHPKDARFRLYFAESATARADYAAAARQYKALLDLQPDNPALLNNMAWVMAKNKDPKALELAEKAYKLSPDQPNIIDTLGSLLVEKGQLDRGIELLRRAYSLMPGNPTIRFNLANALLKSGNTAEARTLLIELSGLGESFAQSREVAELLKSIQ
ncbi:MAG: PEP-CTERM system TPR-repeat protein PrsT [Candidatus Accumulibacter sp.]|jgi:putative PEP-CTERM system TPR-repeat lipoprotein|nr:PEP-CTERM system TPR-repeat protein PrsT [Accumulibacter sp.]